jgi:hypothetical protein
MPVQLTPVRLASVVPGTSAGALQVPADSDEYSGRWLPSVPTAVQLVAAVQLTASNEPVPPETVSSVVVPHVPFTSVTYWGWLLLPSPTAVQFPRLRQVTAFRDPSEPPRSNWGAAQTPPVSTAYMVKTSSAPTAMQFPALGQLTPSNDPDPVVGVASWVRAPQVPAVSVA